MKLQHMMCGKYYKPYVRNGVPNKVYMRKRLISFKMNVAKTMDENLDEFKRFTSEINQ